jgi:hypothetical protein
MGDSLMRDIERIKTAIWIKIHHFYFINATTTAKKLLESVNDAKNIGHY